MSVLVHFYFTSLYGPDSAAVHLEINTIIVSFNGVCVIDWIETHMYPDYLWFPWILGELFTNDLSVRPVGAKKSDSLLLEHFRQKKSHMKYYEIQYVYIQPWDVVYSEMDTIIRAETWSPNVWQFIMKKNHYIGTR